MIKIRLADLKATISQRPLGYYQEVIAAGTVTNEILELSPEAYDVLRTKYSPKPQVIRNAAGAVARLTKAVVKGGKVRVSDEEHHRRLDICHVCEFFQNGRCLKCGCIINLKNRLATEHCPINKW